MATAPAATLELDGTERGIAAVVRTATDELATVSLDQLVEALTSGAYDDVLTSAQWDSYESTLHGSSALTDPAYTHAAIVTAEGLVEVAPVDFTYFAREWADARAADMVQQVSGATRDALRFIVKDGVGRGESIDTMARRIKDVVGLHQRYAVALSNYEQSLREQGVPARRVRELVATYRKTLVLARSRNIARTETQMAMSAGRQAAWMKAAQRGSIGYDAVREWVVADDERLCPTCSALDGKRASLTGAFEGDYSAPPAHPSCRCSVVIAELGTTY